jgi:hypothetical protein
MDTLYGFSRITSPALYRTRNSESSPRKARNYPSDFGRPKLGYELYETAPSSILSVLETV